MVAGVKSAGLKLVFGLVCLGWIGLFLVFHWVGSGGVSLLLGGEDQPVAEAREIVRTPWTEAILLDGENGWEWVLPSMDVAGTSPVTREGKLDPRWRQALAAPRPVSALLGGIEGLMVIRRKTGTDGVVRAELLAAEKLEDLGALAALLSDRKGLLVEGDSADLLRIRGDGAHLECRFRPAPGASQLPKGTVRGWLLVSRID